jgi:hypothetical protein
MKKIKVSFIALLALMIGTVASSFTIHSPKKTADSWFRYDGGTVTSPASYTQVSMEPGCIGSNTLCAIYTLVGTNSKPDQNALNNLSAASNGFTQSIDDEVDLKQ